MTILLVYTFKIFFFNYNVYISENDLISYKFILISLININFDIVGPASGLVFYGNHFNFT